MYAIRSYYDGAEVVALKRLLPPGGVRMLEVGAGAGRNTPRYKNFKQVVLMDYSVTQLESITLKNKKSGKSVSEKADAVFIFIGAVVITSYSIHYTKLYEVRPQHIFP